MGSDARKGRVSLPSPLMFKGEYKGVLDHWLMPSDLYDSQSLRVKPGFKK